MSDQFRSGVLVAPFEEISVQVDRYHYIRIEYRGDLDTMLKAGVIKQEWLADRKTISTKLSVTDTVKVFRTPKKTQPNRAFVTFCISEPENAQVLPGVAALFPEGLTLWDYDKERAAERRKSLTTEERAIKASEVFGAPYQHRHRPIGRFQRSVEWYNVQKLIIPNWSSVRCCGELARG